MKDMRLNNIINKETDILDIYISEIFDKNIWKAKEIWQIAEVTYSYKFDESLDTNEIRYKQIENAIFFNSTLLTSIWWIKYEEWIEKNEETRLNELETAWIEIKNILTNKITLIKNTILELNNIENESNINKTIFNTQKEINEKEIFELKKEIFIGSLKNNKLLLEQALVWLPFELEKAWLKHNLSEEEVNKKIKQLDDFDDKLFSWKIDKKDNNIEKISCYQYLRTKYEKNNTKDKNLLKYLKKIEELLPEWYIYKKYNEPEKITEKEINTKNNINEYVNIFNQYLSWTNIDYKVEIDSSVWSITDTPKSLKIPVTNKTKKLDLEMIIRLIAHEFTSHTKNLINWNILLWNFRWARNIEKEEWLAMLSESLFLYWKNFYKQDVNWKFFIDKDKINISSYHPKTLLAEILSWEDLLDFLVRYEKIELDNTTPLRRFLRLKRLRPLDKAWCQHKDTTYIRWQFKVADYINAQNNPENLYLWKVWLKDIDKLVKIKELQEENWKKLELAKPTLTYEYIYFKLLQKYKPKIYRKIKYRDYLSEKYPMFHFDLTEQPSYIIDNSKANILRILNTLHTNVQKGILEKKAKEKERKIKELLKSLNSRNFKMK